MCKKAWMKNDHRKRPRSNGKLISRGKELWRRSLPIDAPLHHFARQQTCWSGLRVRFCVPRLSRRIHIVFIMQPSACGLSHHMVKCDFRVKCGIKQAEGLQDEFEKCVHTVLACVGTVLTKIYPKAWNILPFPDKHCIDTEVVSWIYDIELLKCSVQYNIYYAFQSTI